MGRRGEVKQRGVAWAVVVLYVQGLGTKEWREFGRTEVIDNTLNPDFVRKFVLDFFFEEKQNLRYDVYNVDTRSSNLSKHDFLGQMFCTLGEIIGSTGSRLERTLSRVSEATESIECSPRSALLGVSRICSPVLQDGVGRTARIYFQTLGGERKRAPWHLVRGLRGLRRETHLEHRVTTLTRPFGRLKRSPDEMWVHNSNYPPADLN
ncbi:Copine-8 [Liparis tanakae]|uniref:Copine-8 n=1 Tax=Liparis tanakae TaxID=230148 RepID=A0A4Z2IPS3_9TELE|nr:Copine-8 [Liparis tanakae]